MNSDVNIFSIHDDILNKFKKEEDMINDYNIIIEKLNNINKTSTNIIEINKNNIQIQELTDKIANAKSKNNKALYIVSSIKYLTEYKKIVDNPVKIDFTTNKTVAPVNCAEKNILIIKYLNVAELYIDINQYISHKSGSEKIIDSSICVCGKKMKNIQDEFICNNCGIKSNNVESFAVYKDIDRVNISSTYKYDMRQHLKEALDNYQGKQKTIVPQEVYDIINMYVKNMNIDVITKKIIWDILKENKYSVYYNDVNKIHHEITGIPLPNILDIEDKINKDIDDISQVYEEVKNPNRKNFINAQLTICLLLKRHGHKCKLSDFHILSTHKYLKEHLDTCRRIELRLNWEKTSLD